MKLTLTLTSLFVGLLFATSSFATILVANNSNTTPGQYSTLQAAINASNDGDTIHVEPSTNNYGTIDLSKSLTLIGIGIKPVKDLPLISTIETIHVYNTGSTQGATLIGLVINGGIFMACGQPVSNFTIRNCDIGGMAGTYESNCFSSVGWYNLAIENSIVRGFGIPAGNNVLVQNCIILGYQHGFTSTTNVLVKNCAFLWDSSPANQTLYASGAVFENNIFYYYGPAGTAFTNCIFNNNLTYNTLNNNLVGGTNTGSNNIVGQDPLFVSYTGSPIYSSLYNFRLQPLSPGHNAGTDGTDIGPYGGTITFSETGENAEFAVVRSMNILNSTVPSEGVINVHVKATTSKTDNP